MKPLWQNILMNTLAYLNTFYQTQVGKVTIKWRMAKSAETGICISFSCRDHSSFRLGSLCLWQFLRKKLILKLWGIFSGHLVLSAKIETVISWLHPSTQTRALSPDTWRGNGKSWPLTKPWKRNIDSGKPERNNLIRTLWASVKLDNEKRFSMDEIRT